MRDHDKRQIDESSYEEESFEYTREDLDRMYEDAFEGDPEADWNID